MEAGDVRREDGEREDWISEGDDVSVYLESGAMERLLGIESCRAVSEFRL
jgi:hypothetical protein